MKWGRKNKISQDSETLNPNKAFVQLVKEIRSMVESGDPIQQGNPYTESELYSFAICMLGKMLESETNLHVFKSHVPEDLNDKIPGAVLVRKNVKMDLRGLNVISLPWDQPRMVRAIRSLFMTGFHPDWNDTNGICYKELDLVFISNGRHHITAGRLYQEGSAALDVYSLEPVFQTLRTDGAWWTQEGEQPTPVQDYRLAAMYELARLRAAMLLDRPRAVQGPVADAELPLIETGDDAAFRRLSEELKLARQEIYVLKNDKEVLFAQVQDLRKKVGEERWPE